ncbi:hypothetical protein K438DRAFT_1993721 [Mycena galopus ATCC 62051]|nr:hypothetical protein K438DRAFT_1993721 [Mycena galopus ATCC 62051]
MSFFTNSHDVQINGGNFYAVAGSINIDRQLPLAISGNQQHLPRDPDDPYPAGTSRADDLSGTSYPRASGAQRSLRNVGGTRHHPYGASGQQQIASQAPQLQSFPQASTSRQIAEASPSENNSIRSYKRETHGETSSESGALILTHNTTDAERFDSALFPQRYISNHCEASPPNHPFLDAASYLSDDSIPYHSAEHPQNIPEANALPMTQGTEERSDEYLAAFEPCIPLWEPAQYEPTTTINGGIDILHGAVALAALHDSAESFPQPKCHPETRTKMLEDLRKWSQETDPASSILWLYGPAGAGKSAIMQTLSRELQLALGVPRLRAPISQIVEENPSIVVRSIETQLQKLISEPFYRNTVHGNRDPVTIVIDGLDECEGQDVHEEILRVIRKTSEYFLPLRFIVASRREPHICEVFESPFYHGGYRSLNVEQSFDDVRKYLRDEFSRIHREHHRTMATIPSPWPLPDILEKLVSNSSGHFIYASTVIKFIDDKNYRPTERLAVVQDANRTGSDLAFDALDQLYMSILSSAPRKSQLIPMLCAIANFNLHPDALDQLLGLDHGDARLLLRGLHSVLKVPSDEPFHIDIISSYHASFFDFLENPRRSQNFYVGDLHHRMDLARSFLKLFAAGFKEQCLGGPWEQSPRWGLIHFITSLPPSADLLSLIELMNPDYVLEICENAGCMLSWLKEIPSAPADLMKLWEDYEYTSFITEVLRNLENSSLPNKLSLSSAQQFFRRFLDFFIFFGQYC